MLPRRSGLFRYARSRLAALAHAGSINLGHCGHAPPNLGLAEPLPAAVGSIGKENRPERDSLSPTPVERGTTHRAAF